MIETALACVSANLPLLRPLLDATLAGSQWFWYPVRFAKTKSYNIGSMEPVVAAETEVREVGMERADSERSWFSFEIVPPNAPEHGVRGKFNFGRAVGTPVPRGTQKVEEWFNKQEVLEANPAPGSSPSGSVTNFSNSAKSYNSST
jgi:hypothetical protein